MKKNINEIKPPQVYINYKRPDFDSMKKACSSEECVSLIRSLDADYRIDYKECFWVILLNSGARVLGISKISEGSDTGTIVSSKEIFQLAILSHARAVVLIHNHPSGSSDPSRTDIHLTHQLNKAFKLFQIDLNDHIIITKESYLSMADEGIFDFN